MSTEEKEINESLNDRVNGFNNELIPLLAKYELGLVAVPFITENGTIGAKPSLINVPKKQNTVAQQPESKPQTENQNA